LLFASTNLEHNNAVALKEMIEDAHKPLMGTADRSRAIRRR
jgi:hypothetical protein